MLNERHRNPYSLFENAPDTKTENPLMPQTNPKAEAFVRRSAKWQEELARLRAIILECGLDEALKWGVPCYTLGDNNIVLIHEFKEYCAILFFKGALLSDPHGLLIQQTENVQATRQLRFTTIDEVREREETIKEYIHEAIAAEQAGLKVPMKETSEFRVPKEFQEKLDEMPELKAAFEALTPGRQRGYLLYFAAPKQSKTREARIEKCMQQIFEGKGLNDG